MAEILVMTLVICPQPKGLHHKLICYYDDKNHNPHLVLSPVKVEVLHVDPVIYM